MMLVLYGPTAVGKTDLGIELCGKLDGEIISADSRQVYKGLDVGTGKIIFGKNVKKHDGYWLVNGARINGFDLVDPGKSFSAFDFINFAHKEIKRLKSANKLPIIVGGTGFYIESLIKGLGGIGVNKELREEISKLSLKNLQDKLIQVNENRAKLMNKSDWHNPRRLIRAIEIGGVSRKSGVFKLEESLIVGLTAPNSFIYQKVDMWLGLRLDHGLVEEVKRLITDRTRVDWLLNLGLEYRWVTKYVLGEIGFEEAKEKLRGDIHSFVRRQKTWFRKFKDIELFDTSTGGWKGRLVKRINLWIAS